MNEQHTGIYNALTKLDYAIGQLESAIDAEQESKRRQSDMFQTLQTEKENAVQKQIKAHTLDKKNIVKTLEKSIKTIETVLKKAS